MSVYVYFFKDFQYFIYLCPTRGCGFFKGFVKNSISIFIVRKISFLGTSGTMNIRRKVVYALVIYIEIVSIPRIYKKKDTVRS